MSGGTALGFWKDMRPKLIVLSVLLLTLLAFTSVTGGAKPAFVSSEAQFTDSSASGLAIVPASCASFAHYAGECDVPPAPNPATHCGIAISPNSISTGQSTALGWSVNPNFGFFTLTTQGSINHGVGSVPASGQASIVPLASTFYTYSGTQRLLGVPVRSFTCSAQVTVAGASPVPDNSDDTFFGGGGACTLISYCDGSDRFTRDTSCSSQFVERCSFGCEVGACLPAPRPSGHIQVLPRLVRSGDITSVSWNAENVQSCTVAGTNKDGTGQNETGVWSGTSGTRVSSTITGQTTYTLTCAGVDGSTLIERASVNTIPDFEER